MNKENSPKQRLLLRAAPAGIADKHQETALSPFAGLMQSPEDNVHNGEISPEEFDRLSLLLRPPSDRCPEDSSPMDTSPSPFTGPSFSESAVLYHLKAGKSGIVLEGLEQFAALDIGRYWTYLYSIPAWQQQQQSGYTDSAVS